METRHPNHTQATRQADLQVLLKRDQKCPSGGDKQATTSTAKSVKAPLELSIYL